MIGLMTSARSVAALPVVDLQTEPGQLRDGLREAAHAVGFFYLTGHGVPGALVSRVLEAARRLFALPQADKDAVAMVRSPHFRGYTRLGGELTQGEVDWREQIDVGPERPPIGGPGKPDYLWLQGPNQWPAALPKLPGIIAEWDAALSGVARTLLQHWAASLGSPPDVFDAAFAETPATLIKIVRYPACAASRAGCGSASGRRGAHAAVGRAGQPGPASAAPGSQEWVDEWVNVPPLDGAFIVNIGELLEVATGGYLRATEHRVNLRQPARRADFGAVFLQSPAGRADTCAVAARRTGGTRRPHLDSVANPSDPIFSVYGRNAWKSRLRAHPDVAAAHGYSPGVGSGARIPFFGPRGE